MNKINCGFKFLFLIIILAFNNLVLGDEAFVLKVATNPAPKNEILEFIKPDLAKLGIELQIVVFTDYIMPNKLVEQGKAHANYFQHQPYLNKYNQDHKTNLISIAPVHIEPFGIYSNKINNISELRTNAKIAVPLDHTNQARALLLLEQAGVIKLKKGVGIEAELKNIIENPKNVEIIPIEYGKKLMFNILDKHDLAMLNANYAITAHLDPLTDSLLIEEGLDSPYAVFIVTSPSNKNLPAIKKLVEVMQSNKVKTFMKTKYKGSIIPAF